MKNRRNYYRLLQVQFDAAPEVIRSSFRTLMKELGAHPDLGGSHSAAILLNEAYETLIDPKRRAEYDRSLSEESKKRAFSNAVHQSTETQQSASNSFATRESVSSVYDRRYCERIKRDERVVYYVGGPKRSEGQIVNFSPEGILFLSREPLPVNSIVTVYSSLVEATASVRYCLLRFPSDEKVYAVGLSFLSVQFASPKGSLLSTVA